MKETSKLQLGHIISSKIYFSQEEKLIIIKDYLSGNETKRAVYKRYTGYAAEHGKLIKWMRELGVVDKSVNRSNFVSMSNKKKSTIDFEKLQLENRIAELEKQLKDAEMKAIAFSTMVDIAEKEFNIPIRKKLNTKPSKK